MSLEAFAGWNCTTIEKEVSTGFLIKLQEKRRTQMVCRVLGVKAMLVGNARSKADWSGKDGENGDSGRTGPICAAASSHLGGDVLAKPKQDNSEGHVRMKPELICPIRGKDKGTWTEIACRTSGHPRASTNIVV
jgi:hypothetical protein